MTKTEKPNRKDFHLYDVIDKDGPFKGLHHNSLAINYEDAVKLSKTAYSPTEIVETKDKKWEDYVYNYRFK